MLAREEQDDRCTYLHVYVKKKIDASRIERGEDESEAIGERTTFQTLVTSRDVIYNVHTIIYYRLYYPV